MSSIKGIPVRCICCGTIIGHISDSSEYESGMLCISCFKDMKENGMIETELEEILQEWQK